jgi:hypothetical protein
MRKKQQQRRKTGPFEERFASVTLLTLATPIIRITPDGRAAVLLLHSQVKTMESRDVECFALLDITQMLAHNCTDSNDRLLALVTAGYEDTKAYFDEEYLSFLVCKVTIRNINNNNGSTDIVSEKVLVSWVGRFGRLCCLDLLEGSLVWKSNGYRAVLGAVATVSQTEQQLQRRNKKPKNNIPQDVTLGNTEVPLLLCRHLYFDSHGDIDAVDMRNGTSLWHCSGDEYFVAPDWHAETDEMNEETTDMEEIVIDVDASLVPGFSNCCCTQARRGWLYALCTSGLPRTPALFGMQNVHLKSLKATHFLP